MYGHAIRSVRWSHSDLRGTAGHTQRESCSVAIRAVAVRRGSNDRRGTEAGPEPARERDATRDETKSKTKLGLYGSLP